MNNSPATTPSWPPSSLCCRSFFSVCTLGSYNPFSTLVRVVKKKIIYLFWLCQTFLAAQSFSSCSEQELLSSFGAKASHCGGFLLRSTGCRVHRL